MVAAAAMAGVPLLNGFLSKEMFLAEAVASVNTHGLNLVLPALATLASAFSVLYSLRFIHTTFFGPPPTELDRVPHEPPAWMRRPVEVLVALCLVVGIFPAVTVGPFLKSAAVSVLGFDLPYYSLALWHGFNLPLVLSLIALGGGVALYVAFGRRINANPRGGPWGWKRLNGGWLFERSMTGLFKGSEAMVRLFGGHAPAAAVCAPSFWSPCWREVCPRSARGLIIRPIIPTPTLANWAFAGLWAVGASCAVAAAWQAKYHRLAGRRSDGRRGSGQLPVLRLAVGAGPGRDPVAGRGGDHRPCCCWACAGCRNGWRPFACPRPWRSGLAGVAAST